MISVALALVLAFGPAPFPSLGAHADDPPDAPKEAILAFARGQVGERVGDGECTTLVVEAFRAAGARRLPPFGPDADYVWGDLVEDRAEVRPGDVLQFRDARFKGRRRVVRNGRAVVERWSRSFPHHSAIVDEVLDRGRVLVILHQNIGPPGSTEDERKVVRRDTLRLTELQKGGWVKAYRPLAR